MKQSRNKIATAIKKNKKKEEEEGGASREEVRLGHYRQTIRYDTKRMRMKYTFITRKKVK